MKLLDSWFEGMHASLTHWNSVYLIITRPAYEVRGKVISSVCSSTRGNGNVSELGNLCYSGLMQSSLSCYRRYSLRHVLLGKYCFLFLHCLNLGLRSFSELLFFKKQIVWHRSKYFSWATGGHLLWVSLCMLSHLLWSSDSSLVPRLLFDWLFSGHRPFS